MNELILLVDDEPQIVQQARDYLEHGSFRVVAAGDGKTALTVARQAKPDLEVRVPESNRGEFAQLSNSFNHMVEELALTDRQRRNLTADVAHELRTPLQIIQGNLEGILDGIYQPTPEHLEATLAETRLLRRLVEDLRVLSEAETGQLSMQWESINVSELVSDVATSFSGQAQVAGITLSLRWAGQDAAGEQAPPMRVRGDYGRLEQVLGNLLTNAIRHTPEGGTVTLQAGRGHNGVRLLIADTGEGLRARICPSCLTVSGAATVHAPMAKGQAVASVLPSPANWSRLTAVRSTSRVPPGRARRL
jgi:signal transduction histidine kinase